VKVDGFPRLPAAVATAVSARWPDVGHQWCLQVEEELRDLCERYKVKPVEVMKSRFGFVVSVVRRGLSLVMRASPDPNGLYQAETARALAGLQVAPPVHEVINSETGTWTVLDRIVPGAPLLDTEVSPDSLVPLAAMLRPIGGAPAPCSDMPTLGDWLRSRLEGDSISDLPPGFEIAPRNQRHRALSMLRDLEFGSMGQLCHGDASPWNVLAHRGGRTVLIDPRGVSGEMAYDAAVVALKLKQYLALGETGVRLAKLVNVESDRVLAWIEVAEAARV
jgi:streptomycin 6-kinase